MFAKIIAIALLVAAIVLLFFGFTADKLYATIAIPVVVLLATVYILSPQINWWYYSKYPAKLNKQLIFMLNKQHRFYQNLNVEDKKRFEHRLHLAMMGFDFMPMVMETVPEDLKAAFAANVVQLTFGQEDFLLQQKYEKIVIYPSPFPSPQFPKQFHSSEIYSEDGVMMFSAQHLMKGFMQPRQYYNSGMHECAQAYLRLYPNANYPVLPDDIWTQLEAISHFPKNRLQEWIGLENISPMAVAINHFMVFPEAFSREMPKEFKRFREVFGF